MRTVIKVENNLKEILTFLEEKGYKWSSGDVPTTGVNWGSKLIIITDKTLTHRSITSYDPKAITFEQFRNQIDMKTTNILPGYKIVLENGNTFVIMEYKNTKIAFPEGSNRSITALDELCEVDLTPKYGVSRIMKVLNALNIPIWERKFTRSKIETGFTMTNENGVNYLVVNNNCDLRIMNTEYFVVGPCLYDIMNEDLTPFDSDHAEIVEIKDKEGKVIAVNHKKGTVIVEGVNMITKHTKPSVANQQGGIIHQEAPIDASNVMYVTEGKVSRIGFKMEGDKKVRVAKATGKVID